MRSSKVVRVVAELTAPTAESVLDRMKAFDTLTFMEEFQRYWTPQE